EGADDTVGRDGREPSLPAVEEGLKHSLLMLYFLPHATEVRHAKVQRAEAGRPCRRMRARTLVTGTIEFLRSRHGHTASAFFLVTQEGGATRDNRDRSGNSRRDRHGRSAVHRASG